MRGHLPSAGEDSDLCLSKITTELSALTGTEAALQFLLHPRVNTRYQRHQPKSSQQSSHTYCILDDLVSGTPQCIGCNPRVSIWHRTTPWPLPIAAVAHPSSPDLQPIYPRLPPPTGPEVLHYYLL